jgi:quercetin dioxygenase-like cupin family protein
MRIGRSLRFSLFAVLPAVCLQSVAGAQEVEGAMRNTADMKFVPVPGLPTCSPAAVQSGDPSKGPSIIAGKMAAGCSIPWHWHTPNEYVIMSSGSARIDMKDGKSFTLKAGGFALMPARHVHRFRCLDSCLAFVYSDAVFDIHYVDADGHDLSADDALKAVKETPAKAGK